MLEMDILTVSVVDYISNLYSMIKEMADLAGRKDMCKQRPSTKDYMPENREIWSGADTGIYKHDKMEAYTMDHNKW